MRAEWLASVNGQEYGPYTWQQMLQMAAEGRVPPDLPVKRVRDQKWFKAAQVPGLVKPAAPAAASANAFAPPSASRKGDSHLKRGKPLAATPSEVTPPPPPKSPPKAAEPPPVAPGASAKVGGWPVIVTDGPKGTSPFAPAAQHAHQPRRRTNPLVLVGLLAGVAAVVFLGGGSIVWIVWMRGEAASSSGEVATADRETNAGQQGERGSPGNPSREAPADQTAEAANGDGPTKMELVAQAKTVQSISNWQSMAGVKSFAVSNASMQVTRVWRTNAAADGEEQGSADNYVCVEVAINNKSRSPLRYKGWNSYGASGAILADEGKQVLPLVPIDKTPKLQRMTSASVPGNGSLRDVLVFRAPASTDEVLHLVLPYSVFYSNVRPPYRAIELTPDAIGVDLPGSTVARDPTGETESSLRDALAGSEPGAGSPAASENGAAPLAPSAPKTVAIGKDGKTPSIKEIIDNDPGTPARPADPPAGKDGKEKGEKGKDQPKKPENPFEPKPDAPPAANPLDPLSVVPQKEETGNEP